VITVAPANIEQLQATLARELDCEVIIDALQRAVIADHIRAIVFGSWTRRGADAAPVHTTRILSNVRRTHQIVWPRDSWEHERLGDLCRQVLDCLAFLGDIVSIGNGFWIPGPTTVVELDGVSHLMMTGGLPAQIARSHFGTEVRSAAAFRFMPRKSVLSTSLNKEILQSIDGWLGHADPLRDWTVATLQQHKERLSIDMDISVDRLEIYAPEIFQEQRKSGRWMRATQIGRPLEGLRLCRIQSHVRSFVPQHFLATFHFSAGALTVGRSSHVPADVSRRLRFGLDTLLGTSRRVSIAIDDKQISFDNSISLPDPEARVLSLAWRNLRMPDDDSEFHYFHSSALPLISRALSRVSIVPTLIDRRPHA
jgi:hypothetical protein